MSYNRVDVSVFQKAKKGNYYCGDSYFYTETENEFVCAIADGLGSGEFAKESSQIVIDIIKSNIHSSIEHLIKKCNQQLTGKRGVVVGILKLDFKTKTYSFSSIGNIGVMTIPKGKKKVRNIPNAGYLAGYHRPFKVVQEKLEPETNFIMFSDGISDKDLSQKFLLNTDVEMITNVFEYTSEGVREDDTTLIAIRYK
ncbi:SpoIIE family protein phosphatase [Virgibacillus halodenitrificans]|uniref:SpoIIE family protein phosphatase n=1 Tax=Virgibacillus halodenitrificans TaxID=1482 RepID=UPI0002D4C9D2|nr:SpoIIE family protein phosphatase [Virgibacillus halodenitrificans]MYL46269.1 SpoIIE family protein phosphatase [Virgibacillus halodenitrificans]